MRLTGVRRSLGHAMCAHAVHALDVDDQRRPQPLRIVVLLHFRRDLEHAVARRLVGGDVAAAVKDQCGPVATVAIQRRHLRIQANGVDRVALGVAQPHAELGVAEDLGGAAQRQVRRAVRIGAGDDHRRAVGQRVVHVGLDEVRNRVGDLRRRAFERDLLDLGDLCLRR